MAEMTAAAIHARLMRMAELSRSAPARKGVDMSPTAVMQRLQMLASLSSLCQSLQRAGERPR